MLAGLDGVLFGGQAERIPAHRMQHIEAARPTVTGQNVSGRVAFRMPDVQTRAARIWKHVQDVKLLRGLAAGQHGIGPVPLRKGMVLRHRLSGIEGAESLLLVPGFLPLGFD